ncbi:hypothetical protein [Angustibacter luteus]|uniref:Uncharacterized protein n=1 Tax=Angustibacter luteus TaxID=658456 RepID=A0ABW1JDY9_9ACTN
MRAQLRLPAVLISGVAAALVVAGLPATAYAADPGPTVSELKSAPGDPGVLQATTTETATAVQVSLHAQADGADTSHDVSVTLHGDAATGWSSNRLPLTAYGQYTMTAVAKDADDAAGEPTTETLRYLRQVVVGAHSVSPTAVDYDHQDVVATGDLQLFDPVTQTTLPAADIPMSGWYDGHADDFRTDSQGHYSWTRHVTRTASSPSSTGVYAGGDDTTELALIGNALNEIAVNRSPLRVRYAPLAAVKYPAKATLHGTVEYLSGGAWTPLASVPLTDYANHVFSTDAQGDFTVTLAPEQDLTYQVSLPYDGDQAMWFDEISSPPASVKVIDRTFLNWADPYLDEYSQVHVSGQLQAGGGVSIPRGTKVYLQQSANGHTGWKYIYWVKTTDSYGYFNVDGWVPHPTGYWRLVYVGADGSLQPSYSRVVRLSRIETRVKSFNASPEPVRKNHYVTLKGIVQRYDKGWKSIGSKKYAEVFFRAKGSKKWVYLGYARTTASGSFTYRHKATKDGWWSVVWFTASAKYVNAYSIDDYVDVR